MCKTDFVGVFALLPESCQKEAILSCLEAMFTNGEWVAVGDTLGQIMEIQGQEKFKADALAIGVNCALRLRDYELALSRYEMLAALGLDMAFMEVRAEVLYQLAIQLLPNRATLIFDLWHPLILPDMPHATQRTLGKIGEWLADTFAKSRAVEQATEVKAIMVCDTDARQMGGRQLPSLCFRGNRGAIAGLENGAKKKGLRIPS